MAMPLSLVALSFDTDWQMLRVNDRAWVSLKVQVASSTFSSSPGPTASSLSTFLPVTLTLAVKSARSETTISPTGESFGVYHTPPIHGATFGSHSPRLNWRSEYPRYPVLLIKLWVICPGLTVKPKVKVSAQWTVSGCFKLTSSRAPSSE